MKMYFRIKFPCDYEIETRFDSGIFVFNKYEYSFDEADYKICPLHGKKCGVNLK